jgi:hypothetical protein
MSPDDRRSEDERIEDLGPEQGGGPPAALPWTLVVEGDDGWSADLEHGAPMPCVDDRIEYIAADGARQRYRVTRIVHTVQPSASDRPRVGEERTSPNPIVTDEPHPDGPPRELRAGLPRVFVVAEP